MLIQIRIINHKYYKDLAEIDYDEVPQKGDKIAIDLGKGIEYFFVKYRSYWTNGKISYILVEKV